MYEYKFLLFIIDKYLLIIKKSYKLSINNKNFDVCSIICQDDSCVARLAQILIGLVVSDARPKWQTAGRAETISSVNSSAE